MNIGIDIDWVITKNFFNRVYRDAVSGGKTSVTFEDFWTDEYERYSKNRQDFYTCTSIYYGVDDITPEIASVLWKLAENNQIFYITSRPKEVEADTIIWMEKQKIPYNQDVYFSTTNKVLEVQVNSIDLFVDDSPKILHAIAPYCQTVLLEAPWNRDAIEFKKIKKLEEILEYAY